MNIESYETELEEYEVAVNELTKQEQDLEDKQKKIDDALKTIEHDICILSFIQEEQENNLSVKQELNQKRKDIINQISSLKTDIELQKEDIKSKREILNSLDGDFDEAHSLLEERAKVILKCEEILERINTQIDRFNGSETTINVRKILYDDQELEAINNVEILEYEAMNDIAKNNDKIERKLIEPQSSGEFVVEQKGIKEFFPHSLEAQRKIAEYGQSSVVYRNGYPDFSPFIMHSSKWGVLNGQVEIPHMTYHRRNVKSEYIQRRDKVDMLDIASGIGNFTQADLMLVQQIMTMHPSINSYEKDSTSYIKTKYALLKEVENFRVANNLTWHEVADGKTMQLVPREIHCACPHSGGVEMMKYASRL